MSKTGKTVSVVIPCRNEAGHIARCLDSLLENDYDRELLEIAIVDGMSDDGTRDIVARYADEHPQIRLLDNPQKITPVAINIGVKSTSGDYIVLVGVRSTYEKKFISKHVDSVDRHDADLVGPLLVPDSPKGIWPTALCLSLYHRFAIGGAAHRIAKPGDLPQKVETLGYGCYRREAFQKFGYYNEKLIRTQDREFNLRITRNGGLVFA